MYEVFDEFTREVLFYISNDLGVGLGWGIIIFTVLCRLPFAFNQLRTIMSSMKMEQKSDEITLINERIKTASRSGDRETQKALMNKLRSVRRASGFRATSVLFGLLQIPVFITVFLSLRHVCILPEVYPLVKTGGFLWFKDLSVYDPYFVLPILSAALTYWSISLATSRAAGGSMQMPIMQFFRMYSRYALGLVQILPYHRSALYDVVQCRDEPVFLLGLSKYPSHYPGLSQSSLQEICRALGKRH